MPRAFEERIEDIVVVGEANSWAYAERAKDPSRRDELIHWAVHRPSTGETQSFVVKPLGALSPGTPSTRASTSTSSTGDDARRRARPVAYLRPRHGRRVLVGKYEISLFASGGGYFAKRRISTYGR